MVAGVITRLARFRFFKYKNREGNGVEVGNMKGGTVAEDKQMTDRLGTNFEKETDCHTLYKGKY